MAVLTDFYSVMVRVPTLAAHYPDGVEGYGRDCPNSSFCSDGEVCRVGFMAWADAEIFLQSLRRFHITVESGMVAITREDKGLLHPSNWLEFGRIDGTPTARLVDTAVDVFVAPPGWVPGAQNVLCTESELRQQEMVEDKGGVATYRDPATGKVLYVGRALTKAPPVKPWWKFWK